MYMMLAWSGSEREALDDFIFFCSDQKEYDAGTARKRARSVG